MQGPDMDGRDSSRQRNGKPGKNVRILVRRTSTVTAQGPSKILSTTAALKTEKALSSEGFVHDL